MVLLRSLPGWPHEQLEQNVHKSLGLIPSDLSPHASHLPLNLDTPPGHPTRFVRVQTIS